MQIDLSQRQQQTVAAAITIVAALVIVCAVGGLLWLLGAFVARFSSVFLPLAVAGVAALVLHPYYALLRERVRLPVPIALLGVLISILLPIALFSWFFGALVVNQLSDLVAHLPEWWKRLVPFVKERLPSVQAFIERHQIAERLREAIEGKEAALFGGLQAFGGRALVGGAGVIRGVGTLFAWAVTPVYFVFFLAAEPRRFRELDHMLPFLKPESRRDVIYLLGEFLDIIVAFFRGQLIIALLQGLLFAAGFSIVGLSYGLVIGLTLGLLNIIPYLGSIIGLSVALPIAFFQDGGGLTTLGLVVLVFVVVQLIEGYLLTPKIMGDRTGLHPLAIIIAVFFWGSALGGISGLVLAIPLTAFLVVFWRLARERYIGELV